MKAPGQHADTGYVGRFAPSPTGALHLGSLATALGSWLDARVHHGRWLVRIEDTDTPRCVPGAAQSILRTLQAFGLQWDGEVMWQSQRTRFYQQALDQLAAGGYTFGCACTRREVDAAQGRPLRGQGQRYPGTCRTGLAPGRTARAIRFLSSGQTARWEERQQGPQAIDLESHSGDFVIHRADGLWAYQLAVVVDDLAQGITHVVRGSDLQDSTPRQVALMQALGCPPGTIPRYWHLPLVLNAQGEKLSKQAGARPLDEKQPLKELNEAWSIFRLGTIDAPTTQAWLTQALERWNASGLGFQTTQQGSHRGLGADDGRR